MPFTPVNPKQGTGSFTPISPEERSNSVKVGGVPLSIGQKLQQFRSEAVAPYVARQKETIEASRSGEQTPVQTAFQTGGNIIGAGLAPIVEGVGKVVEKVTPVASKVPGAGIVSGIASALGKAYDYTVDKISDTPLVQKIAGNKKTAFERDLEAMNEYLQVIPVGKTGKIAGTAIKEINATKKVAEIAKAKSEIEKISGMVSQGKKGDIPVVVKTLSNIDTEGVKTYSDLTRKLDEKSSSLVSALDEKLAQDTQKIKLSEATLSEKVPSKFGEVEVKHNFVQDALNQLDELYTKTNDPVNKRIVEIMREKAEADGLSVLELNGIARKYGSEFGEKAFGKTGEPMTSVNAQSFENTRSGLKDTARQFYGDESFKAIDEEISRVIKTKDLVKRVDESVNKLQQRVTERSLGAKAGRAVFNLIDTLSGGSIGGLVRAAVIPRGAGLKVMNALDIEASLKGNLQRIKELQKIIEDTPDENILMKKLQEFSAKIQNTPNKQGGFVAVPNLGGSADDLVNQAKKYETVEEFVKAQGTPLYHGSTNKWTGEFRKPTGERGSEGIFLSPSESGAKYYDRSLDGSGEVKSVFVNPKVKLWDYKNPKDVEALSAYIKSTVENTSQRTLKLKLEAQKDAIIQRAKMSEGGMQIRGEDLPKYNEIKQKLSELPDSAYNKSADELIAEIKTGAYETISDPRISSWIKQHYDGFKQMDWYDTGRAESIAIFDPKNVKTSSQLTDIWKKANNK